MAEQEEGSKKATKPSLAPVVRTRKVQCFLRASKATDAVKFYKAAFEAAEIAHPKPKKRKAGEETPHVPYFEVQFAGFSVVVADLPAGESEPVNPRPVPILLETDDLEGAITKAVEAGAEREADGAILEAGGMFGEKRAARVSDPFGYIWTLISPVNEPAADVEAV